MQLHNTVLHDYISVSCSCIFSFDDKIGFAFEAAEIRKVLKCGTFLVNVVYRCVMQVFR